TEAKAYHQLETKRHEDKEEDDLKRREEGKAEAWRRKGGQTKPSTTVGVGYGK
ncbi:hypothetical protein GW17_00046505, partial [Ensete ventricosum]